MSADPRLQHPNLSQLSGYTTATLAWNDNHNIQYIVVCANHRSNLRKSSSHIFVAWAPHALHLVSFTRLVPRSPSPVSRCRWSQPVRRSRRALRELVTSAALTSSSSCRAEPRSGPPCTTSTTTTTHSSKPYSSFISAGGSWPAGLQPMSQRRGHTSYTRGTKKSCCRCLCSSQDEEHASILSVGEIEQLYNGAIKLRQSIYVISLLITQSNFWLRGNCVSGVGCKCNIFERLCLF